MRKASHGYLTGILADLIREIGGDEVGGQGVTLDQLVARAMKSWPTGLRSYAIKRYARQYWRDKDAILEDGAGGVTILEDETTGQPFFTERQAVRFSFTKALDNAQRGRWLIRDGHLFRIASPDAGPLVADHHTGKRTRRNVAAIEAERTVNRQHATRAEGERIVAELATDPEMAVTVLRALVQRRHSLYRHRKRDYRKAMRVFAQIEEREVRDELLRRLVVAAAL